jgi:hypothetical protein
LRFFFIIDLLIDLVDLQRIANDAALNNTPLWFGEWGLPTQFDATDKFLYKWADAQKLAYSQGAGWIVSFPSTWVIQKGVTRPASLTSYLI